MTTSQKLIRQAYRAILNWDDNYDIEQEQAEVLETLLVAEAYAEDMARQIIKLEVENARMREAIESVLQKFLNSQYHILTGYINRGNFVCSCTYCEFWWHKGEPENHHENCPVQLARELLGNTNES